MQSMGDVYQMVRAFGRTLAQTEWLSAEKLRLYQQPLVARILRHARDTTEFYRGRFDFDLDSPEAIEQAWSSIPILTRAEAVASGDQRISRAVPPEAGPSERGTTSGSTGYPLPYLRSNIALIAGQGLNERMHRWWKVDPSKPYARIALDRFKNAEPPDGATLSGWHSADPNAKHFVLSTRADVATQLRWLAARKPAYLSSYSSILNELARQSDRSGTRLRFELLFSFGTVVDEETRELCRAVFGAEIADTYGAEEAGHFASQCPQCGEYHVSVEATRLEIVNADGSPARPGQIGRVVATSLYNYAQPFVRYEIGDLAEAGSQYARCRRGLPSLRRVLGRYRNVFRFRDGKIAWPDAGQFKLREIIPLRQVQVVQLDVDRIEIRWVSDGSNRPVDLAAVTDRVRTILRQPVEVTLRQVDVIERSVSGKFEDCISQVSPADAVPPI
jgi:phenylacetate-CoA ligase